MSATTRRRSITKTHERISQLGWEPDYFQPADKYPSRPGIFSIDDKTLGGWRKADKLWFDPSKGRMVAIERSVGGPTSG